MRQLDRATDMEGYSKPSFPAARNPWDAAATEEGRSFPGILRE